MIEPDESMAELAADLGRELDARGLTVTTVESCTGGIVAGAITDIAGSSGWFRLGLVTYANEAKVRLAGVPEATLAAHGAVSEAVVRAMAEGGLDLAEADLAVAISGIAGPGGASPGKPVGTVWIAVACRDCVTVAARHELPGDRVAVRRAAAAEALRATISAIVHTHD